MLSAVATTFRASEDLVARNIANETFLVPIKGHLADLDQIFVLNPVGAFIWSRLHRACSVAELRDAVVNAYEVAAERAEADVQALMARLSHAGLVIAEESE